MTSTAAAAARPTFRVMQVTYTEFGVVDACVATYADRAKAYAHALRLDRNGYTTWVQER